MPTTISRTAYNLLINDDGSNTVGSVWDKQDVDDLLDAIDALLAGALSIVGPLTVTAFGTHAFSAAGTGAQMLKVRNTTAGTGNYAGIDLGNDGSATAGELVVFSSTFTTSGSSIADSLLLYAERAGGLTLQAVHASGVIRFYGGSTEWVRLSAGGGLGLKDGISAPATVAGFALLYVDTADGDLKVKFGDGTVKTIVVDT
jgi:hypothetical protein